MNITYTVYASYNSWSYCFLSLLVLITQPRSKREAITTTERWRHISLWKSISFVWQGERRKLVNCWHFNCFLMGYLFIYLFLSCFVCWFSVLIWFVFMNIFLIDPWKWVNVFKKARNCWNLPTKAKNPSLLHSCANEYQCKNISSNTTLHPFLE